MVSGKRMVSPAKATRPMRSPVSMLISSLSSSFARSRRFGRTSCASMLFEKSSATTMSMPRFLSIWMRPPYCGRAAASARHATPRNSAIARAALRYGWGRTICWPTVAGSPKRAIARRRSAAPSTAPAITTSGSPRKNSIWGSANLMASS